jgi:hypothetical protein
MTLNNGMTVIIVVAVPNNANVAHVFKAYLEGEGVAKKDDIIRALVTFKSQLPGAIDQDSVDRFVKEVGDKLQKEQEDKIKRDEPENKPDGNKNINEGDRKIEKEPQPKKPAENENQPEIPVENTDINVF